MTVNSPLLQANETFLFNVETYYSFDFYTYVKTVELLVMIPEANDEETISNENTKKKNENANGGTITSQTAIAVIAVASVTTAVLGLSSLQSLWAIVNIIQLTMLLPLTMAFIPDIVVQYLIGMSFINFNFDFIPLRDIPVVVDINFELNEGFVSDMGLKSASTFVNHI